MRNEKSANRGSRARFGLIALALALAACGSSAEEGSGEDVGSDPASSSLSESQPTEGGEAEAEDSESSPTESITSSIRYVVPDGQDPAGIAVSDDGTVAVLSAAPPGFEPVPAELVVFDAMTGEERWRVVTEFEFNVGGPIITDVGVSVVIAGFEGTTIETYASREPAGEPVAADQCSQVLNGAVDAAAARSYSVIPGGVCSIDVLGGTETVLAAGDLRPGALGVDSVFFDGDRLVVVVEDENLAPVAVEVDPTTLEPLGEIDAEPLDAVLTYGGQLEGELMAAPGSRIAVSPDGSTVALVQPDRIDIIAAGS